ncbi:MAG TPA: hypothetical protein VFE24_02125 [Pirellulales bacterium]|jgi:hypothetical protein|nr:hypothetical protein [Pirellulales bacterium]
MDNELHPKFGMMPLKEKVEKHSTSLDAFGMGHPKGSKLPPPHQQVVELESHLQLAIETASVAKLGRIWMHVMNEKSLKYPAISFSPLTPTVVTVAKDSLALTSCTHLAIKRGEFENMLIVDSLGSSFITKGVRSYRRAGRFFGFEPSLFHQPWRVELDIYEEPVAISFKELQQLLLEALINERFVWEQILELPGQFTYSQLLNRISSCTSNSSLVSSLYEAVRD